MTERSHESTAWFPGDAVRTEDEARFVARLRERASALGAYGVQPDASWCHAVFVPLVVGVDRVARQFDRLPDGWPRHTSGGRSGQANSADRDEA